MTGKNFLECESEYFLPYFRLYWTELSELIDPRRGENELVSTLAEILGLFAFIFENLFFFQRSRLVTNGSTTP